MSAPPPPIDSAREALRRRALVVVLATVFLDAVGFGIVVPLLPLYATSLHASKLTVGVILACFSFAQFLATPALGALSDRYGRRPVILLSLAGGAASMVLFALAAHAGLLWLLLVSRTLAGATAGNVSTCQAAIADVTDPARRAAAMGTIGVGLGLGLMSGPALGALLIGRFGPIGPPIAASALVALDLAVALLLLPETLGAALAPATKVEKPPIREVIGERRMATLLLVTLAAYVAMTNVQTAFPLLLVERLGWSEVQIGTMFAGFGVLLFLVQGLLVGRLSPTVGETRLLLVGLALETAGLLVIALGARAPQVLAGGALMGVGIGVTNPVMATLASRLARPDQQGAVLGIAQSTGSLARTVGPVVSGLLYQLFGAAAPFLGGAAATAMGLALALDLRRRTADRATTRPGRSAAPPAPPPRPGAP